MTEIVDTKEERDVITSGVQNNLFPYEYDQGKGRQSTRDYENYRSAIGLAGRNSTRSLWKLCFLLKWAQSIMLPHVESSIWDSGSISTIVE